MTLPAIVLTAGIGARLDPLTRLVAKPAVPFLQRTLVEHVLDWIVAQGVTDVVLNLHHLPATITGIVGDGAHLGLNVRYSWEQPLLGSAGGPRHALPLLASDTFFIVNGDTLCDFDTRPMVDAHRRSGADVTMAVVPNPDPQHYNSLVVDDDGVVADIVPHGPGPDRWHFIGVQLVQASLFARLTDGIPAETTSGVYRDLLGGRGRLRAFCAETTFLDVGTPRDYLHAVRSRAPLRRSPSDARPTCVVWPSASVDPEADLDECIVIGDVRVPAGFSARSSVIAPARLLREGDTADVRDGMAVFPLG
jgi:NDP-sugar pyrophosphorylase family protein